MKDLITIFHALKPAQPFATEMFTVTDIDPKYCIDLGPRIPPLTARGLQNIHIPERIALDINSFNASSTVHSLKQAVNNSEITTYLKDRNISIENRVRQLRKYLLSVIITRHSLKPFVASGNSNFYENRLNGAILNENGKGHNDAFEFGLDGIDSDSSFIGTLAHELEHNLLIENFGFDFKPQIDKEPETIHEFICELAAFNVLDQVSCGDEELFKGWVDEYIKSANRFGNEAHYVNNKRKCGFAEEAHEAARGTLNYIIEQCKKKKIDLAEVIRQLHYSSIELIEHYKITNQLQNINYSTLDRKSTRLNSSHNVPSGMPSSA